MSQSQSHRALSQELGCSILGHISTIPRSPSLSPRSSALEVTILHRSLPLANVKPQFSNLSISNWKAESTRPWYSTQMPPRRCHCCSPWAPWSVAWPLNTTARGSQLAAVRLQYSSWSVSRWHCESRRSLQNSCRPASANKLSLKCSSCRTGTKCSTQVRTPQPASIRQQFWRLSFYILQVGLYRPWSTRCLPASPSSLVQRLTQSGRGWPREHRWHPWNTALWGPCHPAWPPQTVGSEAGTLSNQHHSTAYTECPDSWFKGKCFVRPSCFLNWGWEPVIHFKYIQFCQL